MAEVTLTIAGRTHTVACRDGEEAHLKRLAGFADRHGETAIRASGGLSGERTLMFVALILADLLEEARSGAAPPPAAPAPAPATGIDEARLEAVAERLESLAAALEQAAANA